MTRYGTIAVAFFLLVGCAGSPSNKYYTLSVESPCPALPSSSRLAGLELTTIRLPGVLDRPQLVVRVGLQTVEIREFDRWAEPLDQMATRVLAEDIAPCQSSLGSGNPKYFVSVSVDEFMPDISGEARLIGHWWVFQKGEEVSLQKRRSFSLSQKVDETPNAESVAAMSALLGKLAFEIVDRLSEVENVPSAAPPA